MNAQRMNALDQVRNVLISATLSSCALVGWAQQEVMVSQYMFNQLFLNPAYAGTHSYMSSSILHRSQWMRMDGAPTTSMMAVDAPILSGKAGLGFSVVHDRIGVSRDLDLAGHFSYHVRTGAASTLSFGLRAGVSIYSARLADLTYWDTNDRVFQGNINNKPVGKFGFGLYWYNTTTYVGLAIPTIYAADGRISMDPGNALGHYFTQHYYFNAGKVFQLSENFDIKPSTMVRFTPDAPFQADVNCNILYRDRFWFGAGYRSGAALVGMVEYQVESRLRVGYAYDMATSKLRNYAGGSHEVMIGLDFGKEPIRIKSPRYF
ncbi:MAG: type IX secretion system membrane protein PorP/SprF [Flavobacteriales bacterium]|nr:type IX secretion system membrane protein PorP/SprF [Flavobacteriales bacterium]